jgi:hypothetical protein
MRIINSIIIAALASWSLSLGAQPPIPRPEYPQPQFQRDRWVSLNGDWQFEFDDRNVGLEEGWGASARAFGRTIKVPYCFESQLSGIGDASFHPWLWYRRTFAVPADWKRQRVLPVGRAAGARPAGHHQRDGARDREPRDRGGRRAGAAPLDAAIPGAVRSGRSMTS